MKLRLGRAMVAGLVLTACFAAMAADEAGAAKPDEKFMLKLKDGTSLVCRPTAAKLSVKTTFADLEIPLDRIQSVQFDAQTNNVTVKLLNGDQVQGALAAKSLQVESIIGKHDIKTDTMVSLELPQKEQPVVFHDSPQNRNRCINNLRMIDSAKEQAAMANRLTDGDPIGEEIAGEYLKGGWENTKCPAGGKYKLNVIGQAPECSVPGHTFPQ